MGEVGGEEGGQGAREVELVTSCLGFAFEFMLPTCPRICVLETCV